MQAEVEFQVADPIELVRPDGARFRTSTRGIESFHASGGCHRGVSILFGPEVGRSDVEVESEIWRVEPAVG